MGQVAIPPPLQVKLAQQYGKQYGVDPRLLLAIGGHETQWGTTGAGRPSQGGYALGYGVTDSGILSKYAGLQNQYRYGAQTLAKWGVRGLGDVMAGKASRWATDPAWEKGVQSVYGGLSGTPGAAVANLALGAPKAQKPAPRSVLQAGAKPPPGPRYRNVTQRVFDPGALAQGIFGSLAAGGTPDIADLTHSAYKNVTTRMLMPAPKLPPGANVPGAPAGRRSPIDNPQYPSSLGTGLVKAAAHQIGQPYVWGGESRKEGGFDCSGLVDAALRACGVNLPFRVTTVSALKLGHSVKGQTLKPGDMIVTHNGQHMVLYAGAGRVIAAPHTGTDVQYQPVASFLQQGLVDIRRI